MMERLAELNRLVLAMSELLDESGETLEASVVRKCADTVIEGRMPEHEQTLDFAIQLGLLERKSQKRVLLRDEGREFLALNPDSLYELSYDQKRLLLRVSYLHGSIAQQTRTILSSFAPSFEGETFRWSPVDSPRMEGERWLLEHLMELGLVVPNKELLEISPEYVDTVSSFLIESKGITQERLEELFRERNEVGALAEKLALQYERERLHEESAEVESLCVRIIGRLRTSAGYDIDSFDGPKQNLDYNRFIEVKGSRGRDVSFVWSDNEMRTARKLQSRYWIYFLGGIDIVSRAAKYRPVLFQDPINSVLKHPKLKATQHGVLVQGGVRGEPVQS